MLVRASKKWSGIRLICGDTTSTSWLGIRIFLGDMNSTIWLGIRIFRGNRTFTSWSRIRIVCGDMTSTSSSGIRIFFGVFYKLIIDKDKFEDRTNCCSLDSVAERTQRSWIIGLANSRSVYAYVGHHERQTSLVQWLKVLYWVSSLNTLPTVVN